MTPRPGQPRPGKSWPGRPGSSEPRAAPSFVTPKALALVVAAAILLCWPMLFLGAPLMFYDSAAYVRAGQAGLGELLSLASPQPSDAPSGDAASEATRFIRSMPYAAFAYLASMPFGPTGTTLVQAVLVLLVVGALAGRAAEAPRRDIVAAALVCGLLTPLPWYASYLMPDIFAAAVLLYAAVLVSSFDRLSGAERIVLGLIATLATASHYGHIPLAAASAGAALAIRLAERRPNVGAAVLAAGAPVVVTLALNVVSSAALLDTSSAVPRHLPVLLARSIEDGPARWHLEEHCADEGYAICELFDEIPSTIEDVLWREKGLYWRATPEQSDRIRQEERIILWRAFLEYPLQQSWSLVRNAALQFVSIDADDFNPAQIESHDPLRVGILDKARPAALLEVFGVLWAATAIGGAAAIAAMAWRDRLAFGREREIVAVVLVGLIANAAIFGGLSAPADRYQGRVVWIVPVLAALFWLERRRRAAARARGGAQASAGATAAS